MKRNEEGTLIIPENKDWMNISSIDDLYADYLHKIDLILDAIDLEQEKLSGVQKAVQSVNKKDACNELVNYYQKSKSSQWLLERLPQPSESDIEKAENIIQGKINKGDTRGTVPVRNGAWDWNYTGPKKNREYAFSLNRHHFFINLFLAWQQTGDEKYVCAFDRIVKDWILHTVYPGEEHAYVWTWRVLEAGLRIRSWLPAFYGFQESDSFTKAGRLLMLSSFIQHGNYIKMHHWNHHNHALMELDGLNRLGLGLPELKKAKDWQQYALSKMLSELEYQVYPDGAHDELSSGYHWVSLHSFEEVADICEDAGQKIPKDYRQKLTDMYDYWVKLVRPDGSLPQNNRSDRKDITANIINASNKYNKPDWLYIITNGKKGIAPEGLPSFFAPYAGHLISRSGWKEEALWSFFNVGPAGAGWVHADNLHLSISAYGKDFLIDSGRFWYMRDKWTDFAHFSCSHNVILVDNCDQEIEPKKVDKPISGDDYTITEQFDFVRGCHDNFQQLEGTAAHTRMVIFIKDKCWVVIDHIATDRSRIIEPMWRFNPERKVELKENGILQTEDVKGANISITPIGNIKWEAELIQGQTEPELQGWWSEVSTKWVPNPCAVYEGIIQGNTVFSWIIIPNKEGPAAIITDSQLKLNNDIVEIGFMIADGDCIQTEVPLFKGLPELK